MFCGHFSYHYHQHKLIWAMPESNRDFPKDGFLKSILGSVGYLHHQPIKIVFENLHHSKLERSRFTVLLVEYFSLFRFSITQIILFRFSIIGRAHSPAFLHLSAARGQGSKRLNLFKLVNCQLLEYPILPYLPVCLFVFSFIFQTVTYF